MAAKLFALLRYVAGFALSGLFFYWIYFSFIYPAQKPTQATGIATVVFILFISGLCIGFAKKKRQLGVGVKGVAWVVVLITALCFAYIQDLQVYFLIVSATFAASFGCGMIATAIAGQHLNLQFIVQKIFIALLFSIILSAGLYNWILYNPVIYQFFNPTASAEFKASFDLLSAVWWASFGVFILIYAIVKIAMYLPAKFIAQFLGFRMVEKTDKIHGWLLKMAIG